MKLRYRLIACWITALLLALAALTLTAAPARARKPAEHPRVPGLRPSLPGEQTFGTDHFLVHFSLSGTSAIPPGDADGSGVPDYVEEVGEALEYAWSVEIDTMGWAPPPADRGQGGDDRLDVYLEEVMEDGYAGYADSEGGHVGDNPNTPEHERHAAFSYLALDDDYAELDENNSQGETPLELMQATVAHEFNHVIQSGYDAFEPHFWLYESTATWMEDQVYDDVNDGVFYLEDVFLAPDTCLVSEDGWYANWLFINLIAERYGPETVRGIWENARDLDGFDSIDQALGAHGSTLVTESRDYGVAMLLRDYEEGGLYPTVFLEGTAPGGTFTPASGVQGLGVDYIRLTGAGVVTVTLNTSAPDLTVRAVGVRGTDADVIDGPGTSLSVDLSAYNQAFVLIHNGERTDSEENCAYTEYSLTVSDGGTPSPVTVVRSAANFGTNAAEAPPAAPPEEDRHSGAPFTGSGSEFSSTSTDLEVAFEPIIPASLPEGYSFDYAYIMSEQDFGTDAPFYVPGGGDSANYDYLDEEGNWLSIAESPSPYATIEEWLVEVDYDSPGETIDVSGVEVLMEDLSDGDELWFSATLILDGLFIVVDGDHSEEDVRALIEGLVAASQGEPAAPIATAPPLVVPTVAPVAPNQGVPPTTTSTDSTFWALLGSSIFLLCCGAACVVGGLAVVGGVLWQRSRRSA